MEVTIIRHGESRNNVGETLELDSVLTEHGENQAELTGLRLGAEAKRIAPFTHALVSPFRRTLQTFRPIQHETGVSAEVCPEICEYCDVREDSFRDSYRNFIGQTREQVDHEYPHVDTSNMPTGPKRWWPSPLEDTFAIRARAARVASALRARYGDTDARLLIVSHAETIGRLVEALMGWEPADNAPLTGNCGIWRIATGSSPSTATLMLRNSREHLAILELTGTTSR
ncbi:MAG: phosphoglycerate mutase family protein [Capsulimonadaceae bacterium]|nr:phosphoglycerate mutase family protein [Capsulimonadaceae bacterium]